MKLSDLSNTVLRFVSAAIMLIALVGIIALEVNFPNVHVVRWAGVLIMIGALAEMFKCLSATDSETFNKNSFCKCIRLYTVFQKHSNKKRSSKYE